MRFLLLFNLCFTFLYSSSLDNNSTEEDVLIRDANVTKESKVMAPSEVDSEEEIKVVMPVEETQDKNISRKIEVEVPSSDEIQRPNENVIVVKDNSGLSADEVRQKAKDADKKKIAKVTVEEITKAVNEKGHVDISQIQDRWEDLSPTPVKFDWIQTKSGEWFKGEIKALYDDKLEFDSDEIGLYIFDFDDVVRIKSYHIISVNIENLATFPGILRLNKDKLTIIQGNNKYNFKRKDVVSFAPDGKYERNFWSAKITASLDIRRGNTNQLDFSTKMSLLRRTAISRLSFDYLGRITSKEQEETANDHRINQKYDRYITKNFFWTPVFSELYTDPYKNINRQITLGLGVGYTLLDTKKVTLSVSGGPAFVYTRYETVAADKELGIFSPGLELSTRYEHELNDMIDLTYSYKLSFTNSDSGTYKHHMMLTLENELTSWLDLDITGIWDYVLYPEASSDNSVPDSNDFQILFGLSVEF